MQREASLNLALNSESFSITVHDGLLILEMILLIREVPLGNGRERIPRTLLFYLAPGDGPEDEERMGTRAFRQHNACA